MPEWIHSTGCNQILRCDSFLMPWVLQTCKEIPPELYTIFCKNDYSSVANGKWLINLP